MHSSGVNVVLVIFATLTTVLSASLQRGQMLNIVEASWSGEVGGHAFQLNGTASSVWAQLKAKHPEIELPKDNTKALAPLDKLAARNQLPPLCLPMSAHRDWRQANILDVEICVGELFGMNARISIGPGWGTCAQICCVDGDKVFLCNDNAFPINPASRYLVTYATAILNACWNGDGNNLLAGGQQFDTDHYNIIVNGNDGADGSC